jgi:hypothetical protein
MKTTLRPWLAAPLRCKRKRNTPSDASEATAATPAGVRERGEAAAGSAGMV